MSTSLGMPTTIGRTAVVLLIVAAFTGSVTCKSQTRAERHLLQTAGAVTSETSNSGASASGTQQNNNAASTTVNSVATAPAPLIGTSGPAIAPAAEGTPQLTTNLPLTGLSASGQVVTVYFSGVVNPSIGDSIAYVANASQDFTHTAPQKFRFAAESPGYLQTGSGSLAFTVLNLRAPFKFIFATKVINWLGNFTILAETGALPVANINQPTGVHLALTAATGQMRVQWTTGAASPAPVVQYGTSPGSYTNSTTGVSVHGYARSELNGTIQPNYGIANGTGWFDPGFFNAANMSGLTPSTNYFYRVGDASAGYGFSAEFSFTSAPSIGTSNTVHLLITADMGYCEVDGSLDWENSYPDVIANGAVAPPDSLAAVKGQFDNVLFANWITYCGGYNTTRAMLYDTNPNTLLQHNGDICYAQGNLYGWDVFMDQIQPLAASLPYMLNLGNHERDWPGTGTRYDTSSDGGGESGIVTTRRFPMPYAQPNLPVSTIQQGGSNADWYSYNYGPIHMISLSTELDYSPGSAQYAFLTKDLQSVNRTNTPWLVANFHRPYVSANTGSQDPSSDATSLQNAFDDLFFTYQVDFAFYGHIHYYTRSCPLYRQACQPNKADGSAAATVFVNTGHAGASLGYNIETNNLGIFESVSISHGYTRATVNRTSFTLEAINSLDGLLMDTVTLIKPANFSNSPTAQKTLITNYMTVANQTSESESAAYTTNSIADDVENVLFANSTGLSALMSNLFVAADGAYETIDTIQGYLPLFDIVEQTFLTSFINNSTAAVTPLLKSVFTNYAQPLFAMYRQHPDGTVVGSNYTTVANPAVANGTYVPRLPAPAPNPNGMTYAGATAVQPATGQSASYSSLEG
ncbi:TPA: hypothetical protein ACH3X1_012001 [Trebouxia sp. C0004]